MSFVVIVGVIFIYTISIMCNILYKILTGMKNMYINKHNKYNNDYYTYLFVANRRNNVY